MFESNFHSRLECRVTRKTFACMVIPRKSQTSKSYFPEELTKIRDKGRLNELNLREMSPSLASREQDSLYSRAECLVGPGRGICQGCPRKTSQRWEDISWASKGSGGYIGEMEYGSVPTAKINWPNNSHIPSLPFNFEKKNSFFLIMFSTWTLSFHCLLSCVVSD